MNTKSFWRMAVDDTAFVELVDSNVLGRTPEASGLAHWTNVLGTGFSRGELMISFSESEKYVNLSGTAAPLAGYLSWYDNSVQFDCGRGPATVNLTNLPATPHLDVVLWNLSTESAVVDWIATNVNGSSNEPHILSADSLRIYWNYPLSAPVPTEMDFTIEGPVDTFYWTYVSYDDLILRLERRGRTAIRAN